MHKQINSHISYHSCNYFNQEVGLIWIFLFRTHCTQPSNLYHLALKKNLSPQTKFYNLVKSSRCLVHYNIRSVEVAFTIALFHCTHCRIWYDRMIFAEIKSAVTTDLEMFELKWNTSGQLRCSCRHAIWNSHVVIKGFIKEIEINIWWQRFIFISFFAPSWQSSWEDVNDLLNFRLSQEAPYDLDYMKYCPNNRLHELKIFNSN